MISSIVSQRSHHFVRRRSHSAILQPVARSHFCILGSRGVSICHVVRPCAPSRIFVTGKHSTSFSFLSPGWPSSTAAFRMEELRYQSNTVDKEKHEGERHIKDGENQHSTTGES